ncbi:HD domain-containing phosphohydrolase [Lachnospiraceae bacterium 47-T17]
MTDEKIQRILNLGIAFSKERSKERLLDRILEAAMDLTGCDGGTLYTNNGSELEFNIMITRSQGIHQGSEGDAINMPPVPLTRSNVCAFSALERRLINIPNVYECAEYDFSGPKKYDAMTGYHTRSLLVVPMEDDKENVIGVVELINAMDGEGNIIPFPEMDEKILHSLGSQAAICLVNISYSHQIQHMLNSFVQVMTTAIDERTPYNANHTKTMVQYAGRFIDWLNDQPLSWKFSEEDKQMFLLSAWLHDIGKLVIPQEIMDKPSRLGANGPRLLNRLEKIGLMTRIAELEGTLSTEQSKSRFEKLAQARKLVEEVNTVGVLTDDYRDRILSLAEEVYQETDGSIRPWMTPEERDQLLVRKGTLTAAEREIMQQHVVMTERMLMQMNLEGSYSKILLWASQHHERLDGTGYPRGLTADRLSMESRLLMTIDIYEALTARDRKYKGAIRTEDSFAILRRMAEKGELDRNIVDLFEESEAWKLPN